MNILGAYRAQNLLTRLNPVMVAAFEQGGFWSSQTIYDLAARHADAAPERIAIRASAGTLSFQELRRLADAIADDLHGAGLKPGDRVAAWLSSRVEIAAFLLACSRNGYVFCPSLHRNHTVEEVAGLLKRMRAAAFVGEAGYGAGGRQQDIFQVVRELDHIKRVYDMSAGAKPIVTSLPDSGTARRENGAADRANANDIVYLAFTSGTTGEPKGVMHSNNTLLANARSLAQAWSFDTSSVFYTLSPLSHNLGFGAMVLTMLVGGELVLHDLPRDMSLLEHIRETGTTFIFGVPAHAIDLLAEIERNGAARLDQLQGFRISGAAAPAFVVEKLLSYGIIAQSGYGMTEAGSHHFTLPTDKPERILSTSGSAADGYEVEIFSIDDPDVPVPVGQIGHIGGRGASLMLGYYGDQDATERSFNADGWFMTGDLGRVDDAGYLQITGRIKDIIIRGGHNIHPAKIESLAMRHPEVERAAALPVKDQRLGEKVCIVIMPKKGKSVSPDILLSHLHSEGLSKYDMPEYFLELNEIPLGASGKILKRALLPPIEDGTLVPQPVRFRE